MDIVDNGCGAGAQLSKRNEPVKVFSETGKQKSALESIGLAKKFVFFFFFGCIESLLLHGFSLVVASRDYSSLPCTGFSLRWLLLLWSTGSRRAGFSSCGTRALECRLSSCGIRA